MALVTIPRWTEQGLCHSQLVLEIGSTIAVCERYRDSDFVKNDLDLLVA